MGLCLGLLTIYNTWCPNPVEPTASLSTAAIFGSLYGMTAISGILYPGALPVDPEFGHGFPQLPVFLSMSALPWVGYFLELRRLRK